MTTPSAARTGRRVPGWALAVGATAAALVALGLGATVIVGAWASGWESGQRDAHDELERAQVAERRWHDAHPDPTEPVLPDYAGYFDRVADELAAP